LAMRPRPSEGFEILLRGSQRVRLDLKTEPGRTTAQRLARRADVLLEGFRPGVLERLGLGPDELTEANPRLVYTRLAGYGQQGDLAARPGHDINLVAHVGLLHAIGRAGGPPQVPLNIVADYGGGGMLAAFGVCAGGSSLKSVMDRMGHAQIQTTQKYLHSLPDADHKNLEGLSRLRGCSGS